MSNVSFYFRKTLKITPYYNSIYLNFNFVSYILLVLYFGGPLNNNIINIMIEIEQITILILPSQKNNQLDKGKENV